MTQLISAEDVAAHNERSLSTLARAIALSQDQFALVLVHCNYTHLRGRFLQSLRTSLQTYYSETPYTLNLQELTLSETAKTLYSTLELEIKNKHLQALLVLGLESVIAIDDLLSVTNQVRDEFRKRFSFPLVLWLNDEVLAKLVKVAPDFYSWAGVPIKFAITTDELITFLQQEADSLLTKVLDAGADRFVDNATLNLHMNAGKRFALKSALKDLQNRGHIASALEASQQFILGRDAYANNQMQRAKEFYEQSLTFWQQQGDLAWQACLLFHIGLWWRRYAVLYRSEHYHACNQAKNYYHQCVQVWQQAQRPDLAAKFINALGEVLQQLEQWDELETVANTTIQLHQTYPNPIRLAYAYGLIAEISIAKKAWKEAKRYAEIALATNEQSLAPFEVENLDTYLDWAQQHYRSWYRLLLAQAQQHLGQLPAALKNLEKARVECRKEYNPQLYLRILAALRELYFAQNRYLEAFKIKQKQIITERQYGFRAFIGASQLEPQKQVISPALVSVATETSTRKIKTFNTAHIAQEIEASRRKQDVNHLIERISRNDHKLILIHGQSGVGKSSLLTAGLVPALLEKEVINGRNILPITVRVYTDWVKELGTRLAEGLKYWGLGGIIPNIQSIIAQLRQNGERNLLTIIIFDQFEEFFLNCPKLADRKNFWKFLHLCLDRLELAYVKVIFCIREDYLHYLLECDRLINIEVTKNDILNKETRYSISNFSAENAKELIQSLTQNSLEPALIDELVKDLAGELGEVRPIELQVIGAQLQQEKITSLQQYQLLGSNPKVQLVERYLAEVIQDCGAENQKLAQLVLYFLTDENGIRPLKTRAELATDLDAAGLEAETSKLKLILEILAGSGIIFLIPESPIERYQLVHDYLLVFIRQQQGAKLLEDLRKTRRLAEELQLAQSDALSRYSEALFAQDKALDALIEAIRAGRPFKIHTLKTESQIRVLIALQQAIYGVRERNRLETHTDKINSVCFNSEGKIIASASTDNTIKLWNLQGEELKTFKGHTSAVICVCFSPNSRVVASGSADRTIKVWNLQGKQLLTLQGHSASVLSVCFSPDGNTIASASADKTIKIWNMQGEEILTLEGHTSSVLNINFSPDGKAIASASADKSVKIWNLEGEAIKTFNGHTTIVSSIAFSPDGKIIISGSGDKTIKLWNLDGKELNTFKGHSLGVTSVRFSFDGKTIASASDDNTIKLWSLEGKEIRTLKGHTAAVNSISFSQDCKTIASASDDKTIKLWSLEYKEFKILKGHSAPVNSIHFSPDGQTLVSGSYDNTIKLWDLEGKEIKTLKGHSIWVNSVSFSPDSQTIVSGSLDSTIKLWHLEGREISTFEVHHVWVNSVSFSPDGKTIASGSHDQTIKLISLESDRIITLTGHKYGVNSVCFSPNGKIIASASDDKTIKLWDLEGKKLRTFRGHNEPITCVTFSPDGNIVASASKDNTIKLWSVEAEELLIFKGHTAPVNSVAFSPDGKIIASGSYDNTIKLWSLDGKEIKTLKKHNDPVNSVCFSPNGKVLASASHDKTIILWNLDLDDLLVCGCDWVRDYLKNNPNAVSDRHLCDGINSAANT